MASTVYYGTSITGENIPQKVVKINQADFNPNNLQPGDILSVYFAHRNSIDNPTLVYTIGDSNEEISTSGHDGDLINNTSFFRAEAGAWTDGEVVNFSYTADSDITQGSNNTTYWEMVAKGIATDETYGIVKIDGDDDESAISIGKVKEMFGNITAPRIIYHSTIENGQDIGYIQVTYYNSQGEAETPIETDVYIPHIPNDTGDLTLNSAGYITNLIGTDITFNGDSKKIKINNGTDTLTVIDLNNSSNGIDITSQGNINLLPAEQMVVGATDNNKQLIVHGFTYSDSLNAKKMYMDEIGSRIANRTIEVTSPISLGVTNFINDSGIYIGGQTLREYIESLFDTSNNKNIIKATVGNILNGYLKTVRYYSREFSIAQNTIRYVVFGDKDPDRVSDSPKTPVHATGNLNIDGYEIVGVITWETWLGDTAPSTPKNANIFGIWWDNNDPHTGNLYLKLTGLGGDANNIKTSVDILYRKVF